MLAVMVTHKASVSLTSSAESASSSAESSLSGISRCPLHGSSIAPSSSEVREVASVGGLERVGEAADRLGVAGEGDVVEPRRGRR